MLGRKISSKDLINLLAEKKSIELDKQGLQEFYLIYTKLVKKLNKPVFTNNILVDLLSLKRDEVNSGPYPDVSFFESANRICSDLTLLHGCLFLFDSDLDIEYFECRFGTVKGIDVIGYSKDEKQIFEAEVFCTSERYFKAKFYKEKIKGAKVVIHQKLDSHTIENFIKNNSQHKFITVDILAKWNNKQKKEYV